MSLSLLSMLPQHAHCLCGLILYCACDCSGKLSIPIQKETVEWFCEEFLAVVDTPSLFTTAFGELLVERQWQRGAASVSAAAGDAAATAVSMAHR